MSEDTEKAAVKEEFNEGTATKEDVAEEHENEGLADHPDDALTSEDEQPASAEETEARADEALSKAEGPQHGTHNAAMAGLQTDGSGNYTPPSHPRGEGYS